MNSADLARLLLAVISALFCGLGWHFFLLYFRMFRQRHTTWGQTPDLHGPPAALRRVLLRAMTIAALLAIAAAVAVATRFQ